VPALLDLECSYQPVGARVVRLEPNNTPIRWEWSGCGARAARDQAIVVLPSIPRNSCRLIFGPRKHRNVSPFSDDTSETEALRDRDLSY
jgi:hypothetical protein